MTIRSPSLTVQDAALFGAGQANDVTQAFQQRLARFAEELNGLVIDGGLDLNFRGHFSFPGLG